MSIICMQFEDYLVHKGINPDAFKEKDATLYKDWALLFSVTHPRSFTAQKLFLINQIRRKYTLK